MIHEKIDLYEYFQLPRGNASGGYLTSYVREGIPAIGEKTRPAMLVCPGGAYFHCSPREGEPIALEFLLKGYAAFLLNYTVQTAFPIPQIEACMAIAYIRENAEKFGVSPAQIAAVGFSAGGHLVGTLATLYAHDAVKGALGARASLCRPDAVILSYPVVTLGEFTHEGTRDTITGNGAIAYDALSVEKLVTAESVPAFIWHTAEDNAVPVENSLFLASAYRRAGVAFSLHIYEKGGHGLSLCNDEVFAPNLPEINALSTVRSWLPLACEWLSARGFGVK